MQFRIADAFTGSLAKLTGQEQKGVKTTAFDLLLNRVRSSIGLIGHENRDGANKHSSVTFANRGAMFTRATMVVYRPANQEHAHAALSTATTTA